LRGFILQEVFNGRRDIPNELRSIPDSESSASARFENNSKYVRKVMLVDEQAVFWR